MLSRLKPWFIIDLLSLGSSYWLLPLKDFESKRSVVAVFFYNQKIKNKKVSPPSSTSIWEELMGGACEKWAEHFFILRVCRSTRSFHCIIELYICYSLPIHFLFIIIISYTISLVIFPMRFIIVSWDLRVETCILWYIYILFILL